MFFLQIKGQAEQGKEIQYNETVENWCIYVTLNAADEIHPCHGLKVMLYDSSTACSIGSSANLGNKPTVKSIDLVQE